jgi:chromosome segregation ATPase
MKIKLVIFLVLVALTRTNVAVGASGLSDRRESSRDDADSIVSAATYLPDDIDALVQAAKNGISNLNDSNVASTNTIDSALETFAAAVAGLENSAASLADLTAEIAALAAEIKAIQDKIKALRDLMNAVRSQIERVSEKVDELKAKADAFEQCTAIKRAVAEAYDKAIKQLQSKIAEAEAKKESTTSLKQQLATLQNKREEDLRKLDASCSKLVSEVEKLVQEVKNTAKARRVLNKLSVDRTKASQLLQLIRENNRTGLSEFLQREAGGGDFVISDAKTGTGLLIVFRVDSISHCLSAANQCSGKSYLLIR